MNSLRVLILVLLTALSMSARAHAFLEHAEPRVGATVQAMPGELTLRFSQPIEGAFSTVKVTDAKGQAVHKGEVHVNGPVIRVSLAAMGPGDYTVTWRVVSVDSHVTEGDFMFHVAR
jgi:methionine-rich copper-binding protein CopC